MGRVVGKEDRIATIGERSKLFLGLRARSSGGPRVSSEVEPPRLTYAARCGTETVLPTAPKGCWMAKNRSSSSRWAYVIKEVMHVNV